jgi:hypothetical protein
MTAARARVSARKPAKIAFQAASMTGRSTSKPIKRKTSELSAKARYSQNVSTARRVDGLMPLRAA